MSDRWFTITPLDAPEVPCPGCGAMLSAEIPFTDHHPAECPTCKAPGLIWAFDHGNVWIALDRAPEPLARVLRWCQENLDELEFAEFAWPLEEIFTPPGAADGTPPSE